METMLLRAAFWLCFFILSMKGQHPSIWIHWLLKMIGWASIRAQRFRVADTKHHGTCRLQVFTFGVSFRNVCKSLKLLSVRFSVLLIVVLTWWLATKPYMMPRLQGKGRIKNVGQDPLSLAPPTSVPCPCSLPTTTTISTPPTWGHRTDRELRCLWGQTPFRMKYCTMTLINEQQILEESLKVVGSTRGTCVHPVCMLSCAHTNTLMHQRRGNERSGKRDPGFLVVFSIDC